MMSFLQRPRLSPLVFDGRWREGRRSIPFKCCGPRWPHWRHTLSQLNQCGSLCSHLLPPGPQWAATLNAWNNDIECIMPKPSNFLSQDFRWKKTPNLSFALFFFFLSWGIKAVKKDGHLAKKWKVRPLKTLFIHPEEMSSYFSRDHRRLGYILYFLFRSVKNT